MAVLGAVLLAGNVAQVVASVVGLHDGLDITGKALGARHSGLCFLTIYNTRIINKSYRNEYKFYCGYVCV